MDDAVRIQAGAEPPGAISGTLTLDEYNWIQEVGLGVIRVALPAGTVQRFVTGRHGNRHRTHQETVFLQGCGVDVSRVAVADLRGTGIRVLTPCSSEVGNPSCCSTTDFNQPALSPDGTMVAVEAYYYDDGHKFAVRVYDREGTPLVEVGGWDPAWTPDGRLV